MNSILDKIRKLLALAEGAATEHEQDAAMRQVLRLLAKHDLTLDQARDKIAAMEFAESRVHLSARSRIAPEVSCAGIIVRDFFFVKVVSIWNEYGALRVQLFGLQHHVAVAEYVFTFLKRTFAAKWRARVKRQRHQRGHAEYVAGLACAVQYLLENERRTLQREHGELVYRGPDLDAALIQHYGEMEEREGKSLQASHDGYIDGLDIRIRTPIADHSARPALLTGPVS